VRGQSPRSLSAKKPEFPFFQQAVSRETGKVPCAQINFDDAALTRGLGVYRIPINAFRR
jgi:hypothetical protein